MNFARKQLEKYGWTDGKGLGKNENGISEALKPKLKRSVTGIGHDPAADFNEHWWKTLYDKAASNVEVKEKDGKTKKIKTKQDFEITNSTWKLKQKKKEMNVEEQYSDFFVRKAILTSGGAKTEKVRDSDSEAEDVEKKDATEMTDEQLFAACGGRTAHKGARHGLKALGKLARIEQQEQMLLIQDKYEGYSQAKLKSDNKLTANDLQIVEDINLNSDGDVSVKKSKKKKKKMHCSIGNVQVKDVLDIAETQEMIPKKSKKKHKLEDDSESIDQETESKKPKQEIDIVEDVVQDVDEETRCDVKIRKKAKKAKKLS